MCLNTWEGATKLVKLLAREVMEGEREQPLLGIPDGAPLPGRYSEYPAAR